MRVLHVTSENPLVHQGGMNRYCYDLFRAQNNIGTDSFVLFPGSLGKGGGKYNFKKFRNNFFRFDGALPVSLIFGIDEPDRYMAKYDKDSFKNFFARYRFDVCHVHSIQGFPVEFFAAAKECGVRLVFTTHDYYPFCFLYNLYCWDESICDSVDMVKCMPCSKFAALGEKTQRIRQSPLADTTAVQTAKKFYLNLKRKRRSSPFCASYRECSNEVATHFLALRLYQKSILEMMDVVHCNSHLAERVYRNFEPNLNYKTILISHSDLIKNQEHNCRGEKDGKFHIGYFGGPNKAKGVVLAQTALDIVVREGRHNVVGDFYGGDFGCGDTENIRYRGYVNGAKFCEAFRALDLVLIPSQGHETYGYLSIESLANGIPVIVSDLVGSKELVEPFSPSAVFKHDDPQDLANKIVELLDPLKYQTFKESIFLDDDLLDMKKHAVKIERELYR